MVGPVSVHVSLLVASAVVTAGLAVYGYRRRSEPGAVPFAALMVCATVWTASYAAGLTVPASRPGPRLFWERTMWFGAAVLPVPWFAFAVEYSGVELRLSRRRVAALLVAPALTLVTVWAPPLQDLLWGVGAVRSVPDGFGRRVSVVIYEFGPLFWAYFAYAYALIGVGIVLLLRTSVTADSLYVDQAVALSVGSVVPAVANVASVVGMVPVTGMDFTPHAYAATGVAFGNALFRYQFLDRIPAVRRAGRDAVVDNMRDGVVVIDESGDVIDLNPVAERVLGDDSTALVGRPARELFGEVFPGEPPESVASLDGTAFRTDDAWFDVRVSPLIDARDRSVGSVLVFRDVTGRRTREQRLEVLNRLLRHNFRNEMTVITGYAELLGERLDEDGADLAENIVETGNRLTRHADKARELEAMMDRDDDPRPVDLSELVDEVVASVRDRYPDVEIRTDVPPDLVALSEGSLQSVVENVVENAAEHNEGPEQNVEVGVRAVDDADHPTEGSGTDDRSTGGSAVEVVVADDGPGIPAHEREVLDEGTETPLKHGSGLGLWLVYWGAEALDADVTFDGDDEGTEVRLRVPVPEGEVSPERASVPGGDEPDPGPPGPGGRSDSGTAPVARDSDADD